VRFVELDSRKGNHKLTRYLSTTRESGESAAQAAALLLGQQKKKSTAVRVGLTGSDVMMRYLPVPEVEDWRLERLMEFEIRELESRSGGSLATSYNLLPVPREVDDEDTMLLSVVREDLLTATIGELGGLDVQGFSPNAVALYNAYLALGDHENSTTLLANFDGGTLDLALVRGSALYFARSVSTELGSAADVLAQTLGTDRARACAVMRKHLDLRLALGERSGPDSERVTRPILHLFEPLPTLLSGVVTLCKAQARLHDLALERVLLTGPSAGTNGLAEFLAARMRVTCNLWNPADMLDPSGLSAADAAELAQDTTASAVAIGLALSVADPDLYALEILPSDARKKRDFNERGIWVVLAGLAAIVFIVMDFIVTSGRAEEAARVAKTMQRQVRAAESSHRQALDLQESVSWQQTLAADLASRASVRASASRMMIFLEAELPATLWMESCRMQLDKGDDFNRPGESIAVLEMNGRGEEGARMPSAVFAAFASRLQTLFPDGEHSVLPSSSNRGGQFTWSLRAVLQDNPSSLDTDELDDNSEGQS
jgi:Tfp pilus assembly PilM family ATPase